MEISSNLPNRGFHSLEENPFLGVGVHEPDAALVFAGRLDGVGRVLVGFVSGNPLARN